MSSTVVDISLSFVWIFISEVIISSISAMPKSYLNSKPPLDLPIED
jgi:hypothetical protein